jgi:hypothetical protein
MDRGPSAGKRGDRDAERYDRLAPAEPEDRPGDQTDHETNCDPGPSSRATISGLAAGQRATASSSQRQYGATRFADHVVRRGPEEEQIGGTTAANSEHNQIAT